MGDAGTVELALAKVEADLADAITRASAADEWQVVAALTHELTARREARAGVVSLATERKRRGGR